MSVLNWIDALFFGYRLIHAAGVEMPERPAMNIAGAGVTVTDDPANNRTDVAFAPVAIDSVSAILTSASSGYQIHARELVRVDASDPFAMTLPSAVGCRGAVVIVKFVSAGDEPVTLNAAAGQTVDGSPSHSVSGPRLCAWLLSDGSNWHVVGRYTTS
ncbi:hypothetical protein [Sorangium sp. So ce1151]|uniref:hypothetical protein n=1 Tax=Sorangium sp. So ce1151 TaxID=3133332 RepID=UPI003F5E923C